MDMKSKRLVIRITESEFKVVKALARKHRISIKDAARKILLGHVGDDGKGAGDFFYGKVSKHLYCYGL